MRPFRGNSRPGRGGFRRGGNDFITDFRVCRFAPFLGNPRGWGRDRSGRLRRGFCAKQVAEKAQQAGAFCPFPGNSHPGRGGFRSGFRRGGQRIASFWFCRFVLFPGNPRGWGRDRGGRLRRGFCAKQAAEKTEQAGTLRLFRGNSRPGRRRFRGGFRRGGQRIASFWFCRFVLFPGNPRG